MKIVFCSGLLGPGLTHPKPYNYSLYRPSNLKYYDDTAGDRTSHIVLCPIGNTS